MKHLKSLLTCSLITFFAISCTFNYSESGRINMAQDENELLIAKKALRFITENKQDSLNLLLSADVLKKTNPNQMNWLMQEGKKVIDNNVFPNDSVLTVSHITKSSFGKKELFKELKFPFYHQGDSDPIAYFKVTFANGKINTLTLTRNVRLH